MNHNRRLKMVDSHTARSRTFFLPRPSLFELAFLALGIFLVLRYAWLMDDAFVYFRYIDNWVHLKIGIVYNQGEFVEGYSSPLWLLLLSALRLLGVNPWLAVQSVGIAAFIAVWYGLVVLDRKLLTESRGVNVPLVLLATNYAVLCYFTSGLEAPLVQVWAVLFALFILSPQSTFLQVLLAASPLVRQELVIPLGIAALWSWQKLKRFPFFLTALSALFVGGWLVFRIYYYADLFPNTFYLKDVVEIAQGLNYLHDTALPYHLYYLRTHLSRGNPGVGASKV